METGRVHGDNYGEAMLKRVTGGGGGGGGPQSDITNRGCVLRLLCLVVLRLGADIGKRRIV